VEKLLLVQLIPQTTQLVLVQLLTFVPGLPQVANHGVVFDSSNNKVVISFFQSVLQTVEKH
jgi:hypothetical protein